MTVTITETTPQVTVTQTTRDVTLTDSGIEVSAPTQTVVEVTPPAQTVVEVSRFVAALIPSGDASVPYATQIDDVGGGVTYVGKADPGTGTDEAAWQIQRITETGDDLAIAYADGSAAFTNAWDDRLSLTYT